jgi:hypothetical protein
MPLLPALHQAATAAGLYAASVAVTVLVSLLAPSSRHRGDARETLKILLLRKP